VGEKILIVDDDDSIVKLAVHILESEGYEIFSASNGLQALKKVEAENPDLIILDIMLPGIDGFDLCERLRAGLGTSFIPILILSSKGREEDKRVATQNGAGAYLTKPIDASDLIDKVGELLSLRPTVSQ